MRRAAGLAVLVLVGALVMPIATATPVAAQSPTLTSGGANSGGPGTVVSYTYVWDDPLLCNPVGDPTTEIILQWVSPVRVIGSSPVGFDGSGDCTGTLTGDVPADTTRGDSHFPTAYLDDAGTNGVGGSDATSNIAFLVTPAPTPTPKPTRPPTPRPTPTAGPTPTATPPPTPKSTPTPTPLPTPPPFIGGGGGGGSGGGSPEGGAACSGGIGRSPTSAELTADVAAIAKGTDPTATQIDVLATSEYYQEVGGNDLDFVNRLYDDVLRHDPTPVEIAIALNLLSGSGEAGRYQLAQLVVLSPEASAIRVDQAFHTLLDTYPSSAELALWVNRLAGVAGISANTMIKDLAASPTYFAFVGSKGATFMTKLYNALLSRAPTATELKDDAAIIAHINAGEASARLLVAEKVVSSPEFITDQVISIFANYLHPTCKALVAQECAPVLGVPSATELSAALTALAGNSTEEDIIAGVVESPQYYLNHGSTQTGLVNAVYQDLIGRAPTGAELSAALNKYPNDPLGHTEFVQSMTDSTEYKSLVVALDYQKFLLRAPLATETVSGLGVLGGDIPSLQTPDETLLEQIVGTPEYLADTGGTPSRFIARTIDALLMQPPTTSDELRYLHQPLPHGATWQSGVATSVVDGTQYETDFVRGVYEKYLTDTLCATHNDPPGNNGTVSVAGFLSWIPGGWFGLGVMVGVLLMGGGAAAFFTLERRRFARIYPDEVPRHRPI